MRTGEYHRSLNIYIYTRHWRTKLPKKLVSGISKTSKTQAWCCWRCSIEGTRARYFEWLLALSERIGDKSRLSNRIWRSRIRITHLAKRIHLERDTTSVWTMFTNMNGASGSSHIVRHVTRVDRSAMVAAPIGEFGNSKWSMRSNSSLLAFERRSSHYFFFSSRFWKTPLKFILFPSQIAAVERFYIFQTA